MYTVFCDLPLRCIWDTSWSFQQSQSKSNKSLEFDYSKIFHKYNLTDINPFLTNNLFCFNAFQYSPALAAEYWKVFKRKGPLVQNGLISVNFSFSEIFEWSNSKYLLLFSVWLLNIHFVKSVHIRSYSDLCFPAFGLNTERYEARRIYPYSVQTREHTDQNNSEYGHFSRSD